MLKNYNLSEGPAHAYVPLPRCLIVTAEGFGNICIQVAVILGLEVEANACLVPGVTQIVTVSSSYAIIAQAGVSAAAEVMQYRSSGVNVALVAQLAAKLEAKAANSAALAVLTDADTIGGGIILTGNTQPGKLCLRGEVGLVAHSDFSAVFSTDAAAPGFVVTMGEANRCIDIVIIAQTTFLQYDVRIMSLVAQPGAVQSKC